MQGQLLPVGCLKDYTVIFGNGRVLAARMEPKITHLDAAILDQEITEKEFQRRRWIENFMRQDLRNHEKCLNAIEFAKSEPNMPLKEIAKQLGDVCPSMMTRWLSYEHCIEPVQQALAADSITLAAMYSLSQLPKDQQEAGLKNYLTPQKPARNGVKTARLKCQLPSGMLVTFAGEGLSLDEVIETLSELLKAARKANDEGIDAKTWERVLRDKANA